jgi:hypothetical protein
MERKKQARGRQNAAAAAIFHNVERGRMRKRRYATYRVAASAVNNINMRQRYVF